MYTYIWYIPVFWGFLEADFMPHTTAFFTDKIKQTTALDNSWSVSHADQLHPHFLIKCKQLHTYETYKIKKCNGSVQMHSWSDG